jgi:uncharacterized protein YutE (UPF0331/DUF86 family)
VRHQPNGTRFPALEQNILKYRALEMVLILFYVENLKEFALGAVRATDEFMMDEMGKKDRLPGGTKKVYRKLWSVLVSDGVITADESKEIQSLIDYRNLIGHDIHKLTLDLTRDPLGQEFVKFEGAKYDYAARRRLKYFREKLHERIGGKYITVMSLDDLFFEAAEKAYEQELARLDRKIGRQLTLRKNEIAALKVECSVKNTGLVGKFDPAYPSNKARNGKLTKRGIETCYRLFDHNKGPLAVAHLMRLSHQAAKRRHRIWKEIGARKRPKMPLEEVARRHRP